jgi:hypothetical protein
MIELSVYSESLEIGNLKALVLIRAEKFNFNLWNFPFNDFLYHKTCYERKQVSVYHAPSPPPLIEIYALPTA